jgi:hypothetical protein
VIRFQIVERTGAALYGSIVDAMRHGDLKTFRAQKRGHKVHHVSKPGWMNWSAAGGLIMCEVISPQKPGQEWQMFSAFLGRLADRYSDRIVAINVQFPGQAAAPAPAQAKRRTRKKTRR